MPSASSDHLAMLLAECAQGDREAFTRLYRESASNLFGVALRILRRRDWAEDVLQESFVNIWKHSGSYRRSESAPMTWMTSIVRNRSLDWLRRPVHETRGEFDEVMETWQDDNPGPLDRMLASSEAAALARCMKQLEALQRQAIMLAFFHGLTHGELSSHLGQPLGTIKTWVRRGLDKLRNCLSHPG